MSARHKISRANVVVVITNLKDLFGDSVREELEMSQDLPAEALGEILARAVHKAWKMGMDPVLDMSVSVHFRVAEPMKDTLPTK